LESLDRLFFALDFFVADPPVCGLPGSGVEVSEFE
jgi:hypothetical protein